MLNREQRRAQLKQLGKKFSGIDVTKGTLDIPIKDSDEKLVLDLMNFDTVYYLSEMCEKFTNLQESYAEDFDAIDKIADNNRKSMAVIRVYKKLLMISQCILIKCLVRVLLRKCLVIRLQCLKLLESLLKIFLQLCRLYQLCWRVRGYPRALIFNLFYHHLMLQNTLEID